MREGPYAALDAIEKATGEKGANVIGYCLGGTLLASTLAHMAAKKDTRVKSATFFTTMVDFEEAGELGVFIDEEQLAALEEKMQKRGFLEGARDGDHLQHAARQRPDLVLRGQQLPAGPGALPLRPALLERRQHAHAGEDAQLLPAPDVPAERPGEAAAAIELDGVTIDLRKIKLPTYILSTREDHIAPWKSTYRATQIYWRQDALRAGGLGPHRRRGEPARGRQVQPLGRRGPARRPGQPGSRARRNCRAPGGRTGSAGWSARTRRRCRRACPATARCRRWPMRRGPM